MPWTSWHVLGGFGLGAAAAVGVREALERRAAQQARRRASDVGRFLLRIAPRLDGRAHKGQAGRVGVLGGSKDYTGAPYYAGQAALTVGADLLYLFTAEEACGAIKSYSPELMVTSVYSARWPEGLQAGEDAMVEAVVAQLPRLHSLVVGPGLGRDPVVRAFTRRLHPRRLLRPPRQRELLVITPLFPDHAIHIQSSAECGDQLRVHVCVRGAGALSGGAHHRGRAGERTAAGCGCRRVVAHRAAPSTGAGLHTGDPHSQCHGV
jgi:hypothetical protein